MPAYRTRGAGAAISGVPTRLHSRRTTSAAPPKQRDAEGQTLQACGQRTTEDDQRHACTPDAEAKACKSRLGHVSGTQPSLLKRIRSCSVAPDWIANAKTLMSSPAFRPTQVRMTRPLFNRPSNPQEPCQTNLTFCAIEYFPRLTPVRPTLTLTSEFSAATSHSSSTFWPDPIQDV